MCFEGVHDIPIMFISDTERKRVLALWSSKQMSHPRGKASGSSDALQSEWDIHGNPRTTASIIPNFQILHWWEGVIHTLPMLYDVTHHVLVVPTMSRDAERSFYRYRLDGNKRWSAIVTLLLGLYAFLE